MQSVELTELHNTPLAFDAELSRKKERLIELIKYASEEELAVIDEVLRCF